MSSANGGLVLLWQW